MKSANPAFNRPPITPSSVKNRIASTSKMSATNQIGAVDEQTFLDNFEKVPVVQIFNGKDVNDWLRKYDSILKNKNEDWENRVDCLKKIRSLVVSGALKYDEFLKYLPNIQPAFQLSIDDLRSVVVREACITVAFLSMNCENKLDHFVESVLPNILNLIQKSQKVFVSSGLVCTRFILNYTHSPRLIPIIAKSLNSKSKDIRRACIEFVSLILQTWRPLMIEKHVTHVQDAIKKGITDADCDARSHARKAYAEFAVHFPDKAEQLKNSLDVSYRKLLLSGSNSGSTSSLSKHTSDVKPSIPRPVNPAPGSYRSNSAIDFQAVARAKSRAQYTAMLARPKMPVSVSKTKTTSTPVPSTLHLPTTGPRIGRTKNRISISQPSSRSGSPSSLLGSYSTARGLFRTKVADDHSDESETSSMCSEHSFDSLNHRPSPRSRDAPDAPVNDIESIILCCENPDWNERREGLVSLQDFIREGNKLELGDLKRIVDIFLKIFNDPHVKMFNLFLDVLNDLILSHSLDLCFCLHLLLTRLFNKLGTNPLKSVQFKIKKTLDNVLCVFPRDLQLQSVFRFLVDPTLTPNNEVKVVALEHVIKLTTTVDSCTTFNSNNHTSKNYETLALAKMVSWTTADNVRVSPELKKISQKATLALFNLNTGQGSSKTGSTSRLPTTHKYNDPNLADEEAAANLKAHLDQLSQARDSMQEKREVLIKLVKFVDKCPSSAIIIHFRPLLGKIVSLMTSAESAFIKTNLINMLVTIVKRDAVVSMVAQFSDLVITKVITLCGDSSQDVVKAAEQCAIVLSTYLPADSVIRIIVPLISNSETAPIKLISIKMLTHLVKYSEITITLDNLNQIMPVLLKAYADDDEKATNMRKTAVFCIVALHKQKQSDEMKVALNSYLEELHGSKRKLIELYIHKAEESSHD